MTYELLICTHKGLVIGTSEDRSEWRLSAPRILGEAIDCAVRDPRDGRIWASTRHVFGPHLFYSDDGGESWNEAAVPDLEGESYRASPFDVVARGDLTWDARAGEWSPRFELAAELSRIWSIVPGPSDEPATIYLGLAPVGVVVSHDRGASWELNRALWDHPTRGQWHMDVSTGTDNVFGSPPGCDDLQLDPQNSQHLMVNIQSAGVFDSVDGGDSWEARNRGLFETLPGSAALEASQDVHSFRMHPAQSERLYAQHHRGVYRSDDGGRQWVEIGGGLGAALGHPELEGLHGFASAIDPLDPDIAYVVPTQSDQARVPVDAWLRVCRTEDAGATWTAFGDGLPRGFFQGVYRGALTQDGRDVAGELGVYVGTNGGHVFASADAGEHWIELASSLAPVTALSCREL